VQEVWGENEGLIQYWFTVTVSAVLVPLAASTTPVNIPLECCVSSSTNPLSSSTNPLTKLFSVKVKVPPVTGHAGTTGEQRYSPNRS
jgi:hypothetical protein